MSLPGLRKSGDRRGYSGGLACRWDTACLDHKVSIRGVRGHRQAAMARPQGSTLRAATYSGSTVFIVTPTSP